jgi:hypothetical protein
MSRARRFRLALAGTLGAALLAALGASAADGDRATPIVVRVDGGGFHWGDAGIGALAGVGFVLAATGCLALVRLRSAGAIPLPKGEDE